MKEGNRRVANGTLDEIAAGEALAYPVSGFGLDIGNGEETWLIHFSACGGDERQVAELIIDISTKVIPPSFRVWRMFPGDRYEFFDAFVRESAVFLDLPGLVLSSGEIDENTDGMFESIALSVSIRKWVDLMRAWEKTSMSDPAPSPPSKDLADYKSARKPRNFGHVRGAVATLFGAAKRGDLVVIPNRIPTREILIGEFLDDPEDRRDVRPQELFLNHSTLGRRVHWFAPVNELRIPLEVSAVLRIPVAISLLPSQFHSRICQLVYDNFSRAGEVFAKIIVGAEDFNAQHTLDLGAVAKLAAVLALDVPEPELKRLLADYLDTALDAGLEPTLSLNINSPGFGGFKASNLAPIFFSALFQIGVMHSAQSQPCHDHAKVVNSAQCSEECEVDDDDNVPADIAKEVEQRLALVGIPEYMKICERVQRLSQGAKVRVGSKGKRGP